MLNPLIFFWIEFIHGQHQFWVVIFDLQKIAEFPGLNFFIGQEITDLNIKFSFPLLATKSISKLSIVPA